MSIDELKSIVYDLYRIDIYYPPPYCSGLKGFKDVSYREWAFDELFRYLTIHAKGESTSVKRLYTLCNDFYDLMSEFTLNNALGCEQFSIARSVADDVMDLLACC